MKPISIIQKLNESNFYYKEFGEGGEIDYIEFDTRQEAEDYAKKVNDETGHETAVYKMSNDECLSVYDEQYGMTGRPDPFAPTADDIEEMKYWYYDDPREEWEKKAGLENSYRYISTHGVGPGTLPKDVQLIKSKNVGSGKVALYLSRPLSSEELKKYDIRPEHIQESATDDRKYRMDYEDDLIIIKKNGEVIDKGTVDDLKDNWNDFEDFTFDSKQKKYVCNHEGDTYTVEKVITESSSNTDYSSEDWKAFEHHKNEFKDYYELPHGILFRDKNKPIYGVIIDGKFMLDAEPIPKDGKYRTDNSTLDTIELKDEDFKPVEDFVSYYVPTDYKYDAVKEGRCPYCDKKLTSADEWYIKKYGMCRDCYDNGVE